MAWRAPQLVARAPSPPAGYIDFTVDEVSLASRFSKHIDLAIPMVSSPMDTVTEVETAVAMALQGGLGVLHYNMSIEEQAEQVSRPSLRTKVLRGYPGAAGGGRVQVRAVKRFRNGFITSPVCLAPHNTIRDVHAAKARYGFGGFPITEDGSLGSRLVGTPLALSLARTHIRVC